jgi:phage/plasmid-like protein (TIGR03299 family)
MSKETAEWLNGGNILAGMSRMPWWADLALIERLGIETPLYTGAIPVADVLRRIFNYRVDAFPLYALKPMVEGWTGEIVPTATGEPMRLVKVDGRKITGPDNRDVFYAPFKDGYNEENHQFFDVLVDTFLEILRGQPALGISSAGRLRDGAVGFLSVELPEPVTDDVTGMVFRPFLSGSSSFDGTMATAYGRGVIEQVCDNTTAAARAEAADNGSLVKVRHTKNSGVKLDVVRDALGIIEVTGDEFLAELHELAAVNVTDGQWSAMLDETVPLPEDDGNAKTMANNKRDVLDGLYRYDTRCAPWTGTALGVFQTFNTYGQHMSIHRSTAHRAEKNLLEVINGKVADRDAECVAAMQRVGILAAA